MCLRIIVFGVVFLSGTVFAQNKIEIVRRASPPKLSLAEIKAIQLKASRPHAVEGYLAEPSVVDCFDEGVYRYTGGRYTDKPIRFRLRCPQNIQTHMKYPLVVWFHGFGESDDDNKRQLVHLQSAIDFLIGPKSVNCYILAIQCPKDNPSWTNSVSTAGAKGDAPLTITQEIFEEILKEYPIDIDKISAIGFSSGENIAWEFAYRNKHRLAAIVPISASCPSTPLATDARVWAFNCTDDPFAFSHLVRPAIDMIRQHGGVAHLTEVKSNTHDSWTCALKEKNVLRWMVSQKRGGIPYPPPGAICQNHSKKDAFYYFGLPVLFIVALFLYRQTITRSNDANNTDFNGAIDTDGKMGYPCTVR